MYSHCTTGGWILGNTIDGTQAEFVRIPHADTSLYPIPDGADEEALVMLSDILPTGFECGVLNGKVQPGSTVAIVGAGPIGLAALLTAQFYSPAEIIMIDLDDNRLEVAKRFGATATVNSADGKALETVMEIDRRARCRHRHRGGGHSGHLRALREDRRAGRHHRQCRRAWTKVDLHLENLWDRNITITTRLVDTVSTPMLLNILRSQNVLLEASGQKSARAAPLRGRYVRHFRVILLRLSEQVPSLSLSVSVCRDYNNTTMILAAHHDIGGRAEGAMTATIVGNSGTSSAPVASRKLELARSPPI